MKSAPTQKVCEVRETHPQARAGLCSKNNSPTGDSWQLHHDPGLLVAMKETTDSSLPVSKSARGTATGTFPVRPKENSCCPPGIQRRRVLIRGKSSVQGITPALIKINFRQAQMIRPRQIGEDEMQALVS